MRKLIIDGNKVRRVPEPRKSFWSARNVIGAGGIVVFVVWARGMITGGR